MEKSLHGGEANGAAMLVRYNADGSIDSSFGDAGKVTLPLTFGNMTATHTTIDNNGNLYVAGEITKISGEATNRNAVLKITANGVLDSTFGTDGIASVQVKPRGISLVVDNNGQQKSVISGTSSDNGYDFLVQRLNPNGTADTGFGGGGSSYITTGFFDQSNAATFEMAYNVAMSQYTKPF